MTQKILVADDEECVRRIIARTLSAMPCQVIMAGDGAQALELAVCEAPDLIVLDVKMPRKDGWQVLRELRDRPGTRAIPVIMLTGCSGLSDEVGGLELGADDYITKPFEAAELRARVASVLRRNRCAVAANPLTRLPGSPSIQEEVERRISARLPFAFLYADLDHFKPYNDVYGYARGDDVIRVAAEVFEAALRTAEAKDAFLGHVGGDDFVMVTEPASAPLVAQNAVSGFDRRVGDFYDVLDLGRGCVEAPDRQGVRRHHPLMTLSIGVVTSERRRLFHYARVVALAAEMKAYCKSRSGTGLSRFAFDRREDPEA
ncbi:MAG: response regulator [Elusimicrobia bacterium]|nr:response regulator [Elusimicrobiota bacterium]